MHILLTGGTGYIGRRLLPLLLERGHRVRVLARDPDRVERSGDEGVEVLRADLLEPASLDGVAEGIDAAYYLVHSMGSGADFAARDRAAVDNFIRVASSIDHVVYLGGLVPTETDQPSEHLVSRSDVGARLREALPTTEFRAGPVIGSGSTSYEMVRHLTERLPAMIAPRWILNHVQPIAIDDVLAYLIGALDRGPLDIVDIGGADSLSFRRMMLTYAEVRGLRRIILPVPVLAPRLAARWIGWVTPISNRLAIPLVEGIVKPLIADTRRAAEKFPDIRPVTYRQAVVRAERLRTESDS